jgi:tetratricopeptide (TPR) repeat protein
MSHDQSHGQQWRAALTRLARLAQRQPEARAWIEEMLDRNMPDILRAAIEVAEETGPPLPELLAGILERKASVEAYEAVARSVPINATGLQELAITSIQSLLARQDWPADEPARDVRVRRHALQVALATRLVRAGRLAEARPVAEQAVTQARTVLAKDESARARSIDAYDVIAECQLSSGDARAALETSRQALALRKKMDDPFRPRADGERRLGVVLFRLGMADEACEALTEAAAHARDLLERHRDTLLEFEDQLRRHPGGDERTGMLRIAVTMGLNPNGFDEIIVDQGFRIKSLVALHQHCLATLAQLLDAEKDLRADLVARALPELAAGRAAMRSGRDDPSLGLLILRLLISSPEITRLSLSTDDFDMMANEASAAGDLALAVSVRQAEADFFRHTEPVDRRALAEALTFQSQLLMDVRPGEAVALMREAVEVVGDEDPVHLALVLHNFGRRLGANGQPREGLEMSARAVGLISGAYLDGREVTPLVMMGLFTSLVQRSLESDAEIEFTPNVVDAAVKMIDDFGVETGADLSRIANPLCGLFDSALRQGDVPAAGRIGDAVGHMAAQRPDDESIQLAGGLMASQLLWQAVRSGELDRARALLNEVIAASRNAPDQDVLTVEHGKCASDLINAYQQAGDFGEAAWLTRQSLGVLLSPVYLAARRRDLGHDQAEFISAVQELAQEADGPAD